MTPPSRRALAFAALVLGCRPSPEPGPPDRTAANDEPAPIEVEPVEDAPPLEVPQRINAEYDGKDTEDWQRRFEREGREAFDHREAILELLALRPGMDVADVGAGSGLFTLAMARAVGSEGRVYAVDVQDYFLASIAKRARAAGLDNVTTVTADQHASGLAEGSIDLALLVDAYHHFERPVAYLADLRRALRADGRLVVIDYDRTGKGTARWMKDHVRADPDTFLREIEAAGFRLRDRPALLRENFVFVLEIGAPQPQKS